MNEWNAGERRFKQLADSSPVLMWSADATMACDWVNRAWLDFTGRSLERELGFGWLEALHPDDRDACVESYKGGFARGQPFSVTYRLKRADGAFRWIVDNARPFMDEAGAIAGCFGACSDVDDMIKANEALSLAVGERAEIVARCDHLLREVQHRVRNNLQLILSIIDMQARADPASRPALARVAGRVHSIAKAQALLLDPAGAAQIDLVEYLPSLAHGVPDGRPTMFSGPDRPLLMSLSRAVPLGLMINEILSSLADTKDERALRITLQSWSGEASIEIELEGAARPIAPGFTGFMPSTLIERLSAQAGARIEQADVFSGRYVLRIDAET